MRKCCRRAEVHFANLSVGLEQPQDEKRRGAQYELIVRRSGKRYFSSVSSFYTNYSLLSRKV